MVVLREAQAADIPALTALYNDEGVATTASYDLAPVSQAERAAWLEAHQRDGWPVLVAFEASDPSRLAGFAAYGSFRAKAGYASTVEHSVYVAGAWQGQGVGTALMEALIGRARAAGLHLMVGVIDAANTGSLRFHHRLGFRDAGVLREAASKFGTWRDTAFVTLAL